MATHNITKTFNDYNKRLANNEKFTMEQLLLDNGYSATMAKNPHKITNTRSWQELLDNYPDEPILSAVYKDALGQGTNATRNRELFFRLKNRENKDKPSIANFAETVYNKKNDSYDTTG